MRANKTMKNNAIEHLDHNFLRLELVRGGFICERWVLGGKPLRQQDRKGFIDEGVGHV